MYCDVLLQEEDLVAQGKVDQKRTQDFLAEMTSAGEMLLVAYIPYLD